MSRFIVAGHLCLDIIPAFAEAKGTAITEILMPGKLVDVGKAVLSTGGTVSNTGLALRRLGIPTELIGKIGQDYFGEIVTGLLHGLLQENTDNTAGTVDTINKEKVSPDSNLQLIVAASVATSYTIVISIPGIDRVFLHCGGANDAFTASDIDIPADSGIFHFGYPPLMRQMFENNAQETVKLLQKAQKAGFVTSLDMAYPDPDSPAGRINWRQALYNILPYTDIFVPSVEELLFMLEPSLCKDLRAKGDIIEQISEQQIEDLAALTIQLGAAAVLIKLGTRGLYLQTTDNAQRWKTPQLAQLKIDPSEWTGFKATQSIFKVKVAGTTGSGDCAIAGFLASIWRGLPPAKALEMAAAVGACNVEKSDAISGIIPWDKVCERLEKGWEKA